MTGPPPLPQTVRTGPASQRPQPLAGGEDRAARKNVGRLPSSVVHHVLRTGKVFTYTLVPLVLLAIIGLGVVYVRLQHGPIAFDVLVRPIERGINAELANSSVKIGGAELRLGNAGELEFRLRDLTVKEVDGSTLVRAPLAAVNLSTAALWRFSIVPARIELIDSEINLAYTDEAGLVIDGNSANAAQRDGSAAPARTPQQAPPPASEAGRVNLTKMLSDASRRARRRMDATSYLTEFALRNATVALSYTGHTSSWKVTEASVDFDHARKRSVISGRAKVSSPQGPWAFSFVTDEKDKVDRMQVKATVRDLVPATLAAAAPPFALLKMFQVPVAGDATIELSTSGEIESTDLALQVGSGQILHPDLAQPFDLSGGLFRLTFDGKSRRWQLAPSPVKWANGSLMFTGSMQDVAQGPDEPPTWRYAIDGKNGVFEAPEFGVSPLAIDAWTVEGAVVPRRGVVEVSKFRLAGGGGEAILSGVTQAGATVQSTRADLTLSAMPLSTLKVLWPKALAPGARTWVGESVSAAKFQGGTVRMLTGEFLKREAPAEATRGERLSATFEITDATFVPLPGMYAVTAPRGLITLATNALEVTVPEGAVLLPDNRRVPLKSGRLYSPDVMGPRPESEISFVTLSPLGPFLETVEQLPVRAVREAAPFPKAGDGKIDAQIKVRLPLISELDADDVVIEGKAKISDGRFGKVGGQFDVQGFTLNLDLTTDSLAAKGDLLINGVPAKISGQRLLTLDTSQQPPIKITSSLDDADRKQLGLDLGDMVRGVTPIEISLQKGDRPEPAINLKADLTNADVVLDAVSWRKPAGRTAKLEADIVKGTTNARELQNFKISGDDITVDGWIGIGSDNRVREFHFPTFNLNVVSRLAVQGTRGKDDVWNVKADGPVFDGREMFRSILQVGDGGARKAKSEKPTGGTDLEVTIGTLIGGSEASLRGMKMTLNKRGDQLTKLDVKGSFEGGAPLTMFLDTQSGQRRIRVDSGDAGQTLRLVDFYPNMQGGRLRLEVNLEGKGAADKTGLLQVEQFKVLGDQVVSEVVGSADQGRPAIDGRRVSREVFEFDRLQAPFSSGYGQFVLEDSYLRGPMVGANLRGKVDFKTRRINLGGTYIPLQGLNSALAPIPLLGQILAGAKGEGIFGITFAVQGPLSEPQVIVNPLSLVAPGIFREVFQMTSANPSVQARDEKAPSRPASERVRASSSPRGESRAKGGQTSNDVDGWSSSSSPAN